MHYPVCHMLSEAHNTNAITHWLTEWVRSGIDKTPRMGISDSSLAIMHAACSTFTQYMTLWTYVNVCSSLLMEKRNMKSFLPYCFIRNDINHTMHTFSQWPEIKNSVKRIKDLYMRKLGLIATTPDFEEVKELIRNFFTILVNEEDGFKPNGDKCDCQVAKDYLKRSTAGLLEFEEVEHAAPLDSDSGDDLESEEENGGDLALQCIKRMYTALVTTNISQEGGDGDEEKGDGDNMQYNPQLVTRFLKHCRLILTWSAILVPVFG